MLFCVYALNIYTHTVSTHIKMYTAEKIYLYAHTYDADNSLNNNAESGWNMHMTKCNFLRDNVISYKHIYPYIIYNTRASHLIIWCIYSCAWYFAIYAREIIFKNRRLQRQHFVSEWTSHFISVLLYTTFILYIYAYFI